MRFMVIVKATAESEADVLPGNEMIARMAQFHEELARAGALLEASGLKSSRHGWRVEHRGGEVRVVDGPFAETKELIAGYTVIKAATRAEAVAWSRRFPNPTLEGSDCHIEVRPMFELEDFEQGDGVARFREMGVGGESTT